MHVGFLSKKKHVEFLKRKKKVVFKSQTGLLTTRITNKHINNADLAFVEDLTKIDLLTSQENLKRMCLLFQSNTEILTEMVREPVMLEEA